MQEDVSGSWYHLTKLTVALPNSSIDDLIDISEYRECSKTMAIRRAVRTLHFLVTQQQAGKKILLVDSDDNMVEVVL